MVQKNTIRRHSGNKCIIISKVTICFVCKNLTCDYWHRFCVLITVWRLWGVMYCILWGDTLYLHSSCFWDWLRASSAAWSSWICLFSQHHAWACLRPTLREENRHSAYVKLIRNHFTIPMIKTLISNKLLCVRVWHVAYLVWTFVIEYKYKSVAAHLAAVSHRQAPLQWLN